MSRARSGNAIDLARDTIELARDAIELSLHRRARSADNFALAGDGIEVARRSIERRSRVRLVGWRIAPLTPMGTGSSLPNLVLATRGVG